LGWVADTFGRRQALLTSLLGMLIATVGQGCVPSWEDGRHLNITLPIVFALRVVQGLSAGGEVCTISTYCAEMAPGYRYNWFASLAPLSAISAYILASAIASICTLALGEETMIRWGWRIPFLLALPGGVVTLWARQWLLETEEFKRSSAARAEQQAGFHAHEAGRCAGTVSTREPASDEPGVHSDGSSASTFAEAEPPVVAVQGLHERAIIAVLGTCSIAALATCFFGGIIWNVGHAKLHGLSTGTADLIGVLTHIVQAIVMVISANLADRIGPATIMMAGAALIMVAGIPLNFALARNEGDPLVAVLCISLGYGIVSAVALATSYSFFSGLFSTSFRASGFALTFNLGMSYFGGFAPLISQALIERSTLAPGIYLSATGLLSLLSLSTFVYLRSTGVIEISHVQAEPFFAPCGRELSRARRRGSR